MKLGFQNKKILLRECKRDTARRVASARGGYLPWRRERVPTLGYPFPHPDLAREEGVPTLDGGEVPTLGYPLPHLDLAGGEGTT